MFNLEQFGGEVSNVVENFSNQIIELTNQAGGNKKLIVGGIIAFIVIILIILLMYKLYGNKPTTDTSGNRV